MEYFYNFVGVTRGSPYCRVRCNQIVDIIIRGYGRRSPTLPYHFYTVPELQAYCVPLGHQQRRPLRGVLAAF